MPPVSKHFEIWQSIEDSVATNVCPAGPTGEQCRFVLEPGAIRVFTYVATSETKMMRRYHNMMG
jgi:hypothetical protein